MSCRVCRDVRILPQFAALMVSLVSLILALAHVGFHALFGVRGLRVPGLGLLLSNAHIIAQGL